MKNKSLIHRALRVVDAVSKTEDGLRFSDVSKILDNPSPSTVNKILKELTGEGVLQKNYNGRYALGPKIYFWGRAVTAQSTPLQIIREQIQFLKKKHRVSANVFTCMDQTMFCLECTVDPDTPLLYPAGKSLPMRLSVQGAVFFIPQDKLQDRDFLKKEAARHEDPLSVEDLEQMITQTLQTGIQDDRALFYPGLHRFSVPLKENGQTVMTLGVGISAKRTQKGDLTRRIIADLKAISARIEEAFE